MWMSAKESFSVSRHVMGRRSRNAPWARTSGNRERRGNWHKGPNGKALSLGKSIMKAIPCARHARYMALFGANCKEGRCDNSAHRAHLAPSGKLRLRMTSAWQRIHLPAAAEAQLRLS